jgi:quercetin dioxygenase-like cupin family protein
MRKLKDTIKKYFLAIPNHKDLAEKRKKLVEEVRAWEQDFSVVHNSFANGGVVTWAQMASYQVSMPNRPIGYPTGKNCLTFRLPDHDKAMVFYTVCVAPKGEKGSFGWHKHPKCSETNIQLEGTAEHNGEVLPPFSVTVFPAGTEHDYILKPGGSLLTIFEKVK